MKRTAEKVLSIISVAFNIVGLLISFIFITLFKNPVFLEEFELMLIEDPTIPQAEIDMVIAVFDMMQGFIWLGIIGLLISVIVTIIGIVSIWNNKNPKLAGIMFIIGGVFAGILSLSSILLYIAGILCFTKKPAEVNVSNFVEDNQDGSMRPL